MGLPGLLSRSRPEKAKASALALHGPAYAETSLLVGVLHSLPLLSKF